MLIKKKREYNVVGFIYLLFIFKFGESGENWGKVYLAFIKLKKNILIFYCLISIINQ